MEITNQKKISEVSLLLTNDKEIHRLNKLYRNIDSPTDVLAFSQVENSNEFPLPDNEAEYLLGDIVISIETAQRQAALLGNSLEYELAVLAVHGFLHLIGFDHISEEDAVRMRNTEKDIIDWFFLELKGEPI